MIVVTLYSHLCYNFLLPVILQVANTVSKMSHEHVAVNKATQGRISESEIHPVTKGLLTCLYRGSSSCLHPQDSVRVQWTLSPAADLGCTLPKMLEWHGRL